MIYAFASNLHHSLTCTPSEMQLCVVATHSGKTVSGAVCNITVVVQAMSSDIISIFRFAIISEKVTLLIFDQVFTVHWKK